MTKRFLISVCIFSLLLGGCSRKPTKPPVHPRPVKIATAIQKDVPIYIDSFATLAAYNDVNIEAQVTGKIEKAHFKGGDTVSKGDPLFTIDPKKYKADLDKAQAALTGDTFDMQLKKDTLERNKKLFEKKLISQQDFEQYKTESDAAEALVQTDKADLELAKINLGYCYIVSPIDGLTGKHLLDPGNIVIENNGPVLVNIKTIDPLYADFTIPERDFPKVHAQMKENILDVTINPAGDEKSYEGKVTLINNTVDPDTGTILLRAEVQNPERTLWVGQYATIRLTVRTEKNAVLVPVEAVQLGQKGMYIYVVTDKNTAELREDIVVGQQQEECLVIGKGVSAGERVVTYGQLGLRDGIPVVDIEKQNAGKGSSK